MSEASSGDAKFWQCTCVNPKCSSAEMPCPSCVIQQRSDERTGTGEPQPERTLDLATTSAEDSVSSKIIDQAGQASADEPTSKGEDDPHCAVDDNTSTAAVTSTTPSEEFCSKEKPEVDPQQRKIRDEAEVDAIDLQPGVGKSQDDLEVEAAQPLGKQETLEPCDEVGRDSANSHSTHRAKKMKTKSLFKGENNPDSQSACSTISTRHGSRFTDIGEEIELVQWCKHTSPEVVESTSVSQPSEGTQAPHSQSPTHVINIPDSVQPSSTSNTVIDSEAIDWPDTYASNTNSVVVSTQPQASGTQIQSARISRDVNVESCHVNNYIMVTFHVIIPKLIWEWDADSRVILRLHLKDRDADCISTDLRVIDDDHNEMTFDHCFTQEDLLYSTPYKYLVSKKLKPDQLVEEFLGYCQFTEHPTGNNVIHLNRVLNITPTKQVEASNGGVYHQYDTMAVPENVSSSVRKLWQWMRNLSFRSQQKPNLEPFSQEMQEMCLQFHLDLNGYGRILASVAFTAELTMEMYLEEILHIFMCMSKPSTTCYYHPITSDSVYISDNVKDLKKCFAEWLKRIIQKPQVQTTEGQFQLVVCIFWCITKFEIQFDSEPVIAMTPHLLNPLWSAHQKSQSEWSVYNHLSTFLSSKDHRDMIAGAVKRFSVACLTERPNFHSLMTDWIHLIPLYSFLTSTYKPYDNCYDQPNTKLADTWCTLDDWFQIAKTTRRSEKLKYPAEWYYTQQRLLFDRDLLSLQAIVYFCPFDGLASLFSIIPSIVSITWLSYMLEKVHYQLQTEREVRDWSAWMCAIGSKVAPDEFQRSTFLKSVLFLFEQVTVHVEGSSERSVSVVMSAASLVNDTLHHTKEQGEKKDALKRMSNLITDWINNPSVIGKRSFGDYDNISGCFSKGVSGMQIWNKLLTVKNVSGEWEKIICDLFLSRVEKISVTLIIPLLQLVVRRGNNNSLVNAVTDSTILIKKAAKSVLSCDPDELQDRVEELTNEPSKVFGKVLSIVFENHFDAELSRNENGEWITLEVLLDWIVWPNYLMIIQQGTESLLRNGLSEKCQETCQQALSKLKSILSELESGDMRMSDFHKLQTHSEIIHRLCEVVESKELLDQRLQQIKLFRKRCDSIKRICKKMSEPSKVKGLSALREDLDRDVKDKKISDLFEIKHGVQQKVRYPSAEPLSCFVDHFAIMSEKSPDLFFHFWDEQSRKILQSGCTIEDIHSKIWIPVFEECKKLVQSLMDQTITLPYIDIHLKKYTENLKAVLESLADGLTECLGETYAYQQASLEDSRMKICEYWQLREYQIGAKVFLELRDVLELSAGDFRLVQGLTSQLSLSMECQTLKDISGELTETRGFLEEISDDDCLKHKCLQAFINCQPVVKWLRTFKSVGEIQKFVTFALETAAGGEGDLVRDKLSNLHVVCSGYASLIYDVRATDGYQQLMKRCKLLWKALEKRENLPELLESCNEELGWYTSIREDQGSIENTTKGQMMNILKYGTFTLSFKEDPQMRADSVHSLVTMTLTQKYKKLAKTKYTLDELRELESKLVLICGNKADTRAEVDHFLTLLHSATRIADLYLELQRAGEITYSSEYIRFRCAVYEEEHLSSEVVHPPFNEDQAKEIVFDLQEYIRRLNKRLIEWKKSVDASRERYYELNYFTTLQLLELQREFDRLSQHPTATFTVKPDILMLLKSISSEICSSYVSDSLQSAMSVRDDPHSDVAVNCYSREHAQNTSREVVSRRSSQNTLPLSVASPTTNPVSMLTVEQHAIFLDCVDMGFSESHVLRALRTCAQGASLFEIEVWCMSNREEASSEIAVGSSGHDNYTENENDTDNESTEANEVSSAEVVENSGVYTGLHGYHNYI